MTDEVSSTTAGDTGGGKRGILSGIRVIDCAEGIAGPVAALLLAEAGAEVIKVERPGGDPSRDSLGFLTWNRSKRSIVADLATVDGRAVLESLLADADILIHGFGPTAAAELELDDDSLHARHPRLITSAVLGWPAGHPSADGPSDDLLVSARLGLCDEQQGYRDGPIYLRFPFGSWCAVYLCAIGVLARLVQRERGGSSGGPAHTSIAQGALVPTMMHWARAETPGPMFAFGLPKDLSPSMFECADGIWIHLMRNPDVDSPLMVEQLAAMGEDGMAKANAAFAGMSTLGYPNFGANQLAFRAHSSAVWLEDFWTHDIPAQPSAQYGAILADAQARACSYVTEVDDPTHGRITQAGTPFSTEPPSRVRGPAPALDGHATEILDEVARRAATATRAAARPTATATRDDDAPDDAPDEAPSSAPVRAPLEGLRVLDLGNFLAGPLGPMLMADLGADVIKLEATTGDKMRHVQRVFASCQRGKRGIALDLKSPETRPALEALVRWADVVHHNLRMPAARKLGLDYESLRAINPDMIYCHTSSYGPVGERADWPGYDQLFQASAGWEVLGGGEGNPPMWFRFGFMDHLCAMSSVVATLLALWHQDRTGRAQQVTGSLLGAAVLTNSETYLHAAGLAATVPPLDGAQMGISPGYRLYEQADGWIALAATGNDQLDRACTALGAANPAALADRLAGAAMAETLALLAEAGVPAEPVSLDQGEAFLDDPINCALGLATSYPHAEWGRLEQVGALWSLGDLEVQLDRAPPALGEHTIEVLREVGFDQSAIDRLLEQSAAVQAPLA
jgi:crotonobetainyl-CoA:carnitine CoA-transferase CaiB-like acyl-CoA transferase